MSLWHRHSGGGLEWLERPGRAGTLVLLHGIGSNADSFSPLLHHLDPDLRVIAWDMPGYRGSRPLPKDAPLAADYAEALAGMVAMAGLGRFTLLGHSLGALVAVAYALRNPAAVSRLILVSPALGHGIPPGDAPGPAAQGRIDDLARLGPDAFAAARAANLVHDPDANPDVVAMVRHGMAQVSLPGYGQAARMLAQGRLIDDAALLSVPTDVVTGALDRITPAEGARRVHAALPPAMRGHLVELPATGHAAPQQSPARLAAILATVDRPQRKDIP